MHHTMSYELVRQMIDNSLETIEVYEKSIQDMRELLEKERLRLQKLKAFIETTDDAN